MLREYVTRSLLFVELASEVSLCDDESLVSVDVWSEVSSDLIVTGGFWIAVWAMCCVVSLVWALVLGLGSLTIPLSGYRMCATGGIKPCSGSRVRRGRAATMVVIGLFTTAAAVGPAAASSKVCVR